MGQNFVVNCHDDDDDKGEDDDDVRKDHNDDDDVHVDDADYNDDCFVQSCAKSRKCTPARAYLSIIIND